MDARTRDVSKGYAKLAEETRSFVCGSPGMCLATFDGASASSLSARKRSKHNMSRTVGMAIGVLIFILFCATIGARITRPVSAAAASSAQNR